MRDIPPPHIMELLLFFMIASGAALLGAHFRDWKVAAGIYFIVTSAIFLSTRKF